MTDVYSPDLILHRGLFATLDRSNPTASAVAVKDGRSPRSAASRTSIVIDELGYLPFSQSGWPLRPKIDEIEEPSPGAGADVRTTVVFVRFPVRGRRSS
jgi:hypothetical protein